MQGINDRTNVLGLAGLIGGDNITDLDQLEAEVLKGRPSDGPKVSASDKYKQEIERMERNLGVQQVRRDTYEIQSNASRDMFRPPASPAKSNYSFGPPRVIDLGGGNDGPTALDGILATVDEMPKYAPPPRDDKYHPKYTAQVKERAPTTTEQINKSALDAVIGAPADDVTNEYSLDEMNESDDKAILLENIDTLIQTLNDDGIDTDRIKKVDENSSLRDIREVYSSLCLKNDRKRYCTMAEELILLFAKGLGWIFDGKRQWFGQTLDMRGWDETVKIKLKRMRYDTSTFVAGVMRDYQMSSGTRIMMELVPSAFMYSTTKKSDEPGTVQAPNKVDWTRAMDDISNYE